MRCQLPVRVDKVEFISLRLSFISNNARASGLPDPCFYDSRCVITENTPT